MSVRVPISIGELWDKYSILLIKKDKIKNKEKLKYVITEIDFLDSKMEQYSYKDNDFFLQLKNVNKEMWEIEDLIRKKEEMKTFDNEFIKLARLVYYTNDKRSEIKKNINIYFNSIIHEVKDYVKYQ